MERLLDIAFSSLALVVLSPLLIPIAILLCLTGEGEIFFIQKRVGERGECFGLFKFATMLKDSPNIGTGTVTIRQDPRILPLGRFLRKTKINELPQLLNILFGDMSIVGPRPLTEQTFGYYNRPTQDSIKSVRPGLSGIQQIVIRDEESLMHGESASLNFYACVLAPYKGELESWFVSNKSIYIYFLTIFLTVWIIVFPRSSAVWTFFAGLPPPPIELRKALNYIQ